jgi:hypothetical protein
MLSKKNGWRERQGDGQSLFDLSKFKETPDGSRTPCCEAVIL